MTKDHEFRVSAKWPEPPQVDERDVAEISILCGERALTRLLDREDKLVRDYVRASAVSLALWFADNWWRLRWEPIPEMQGVIAQWRLRHELTSASGGTCWPPLMIYGTGTRIVISPIAGAVQMAGPMEHLPAEVSVVSAPAFEEGIDAFLACVTEACAHAHDGAALIDLVRQLQTERESPDVSSWRRLEAMLGYDPDAAPDGVIERLTEMEQRVGADAVEEAAVGSPGAGAPMVLKDVIEASEGSAVKVSLDAASLAAKPIQALDPTRPAWIEAEDAAARLREAVGHPEGPFLNKALSEVLQVRWADVMSAPSTAYSLPYGARLRRDSTTESIALQARTSAGRRFELARALGDAVWASHADFGVISHAKTDRQKFQRAFAQSLLCPLQDLAHHVDLEGPTQDQVMAAARRYHVHETVVRTLLVNKGFLQRETLGDLLEAA